MPLTWLEHTDPDGVPAKAGRLARLAAAGLPVPAGFVVPLDGFEAQQAQIDGFADRLLAGGDVIVRGCLAAEDAGRGTAAGLGLSIPGCASISAVRDALAAVADSRHDPWLSAYRDRHGGVDGLRPDHALVQHEVPRAFMVVAAMMTDGRIHIDAHRGGGDVLARGATPAYAGPLSKWPVPTARANVTNLCRKLAPRCPPTAYGWDVEIAIDHDERAHVVQARPIVHDPTPGWAAFHAAIGEVEPWREGAWTLDVEHNPAPLSAAHTWLMGWLARARPKAGHPRVLAGWLYVRTLVGRLPSSAPGEALGPVEALRRLSEVELPTLRARLDALDRRLTAADRRTTADALDEALDVFVSMIDVYLGVLIPARHQVDIDPAAVLDRNQPASTSGRAAYVDVLPARWDLDAPALGELGLRGGEDSPVSLPDDPMTAALWLCEWDDHLFALGLAAVRRWFIRAGQLVGLDHDDVFNVSGAELAAALEDKTRLPSAATRRGRAQTRADQARLRPPLQIVDGVPAPRSGGGQLRGIAIGSDFEGPLCPRRDLDDLLRRPPPENAIVAMPALTAQAAVALQQLRIAAVCCEYGGALSHAALMARELGLSALIGCRGCTDIAEGTPTRIDTRLSRLWVGRR